MSGGMLRMLLACAVVALFIATPVVTYAQVLAAANNGQVVSRCVGLELYVQGDKERDKLILARVNRFVGTRRGLKLRVYDLSQDARHAPHLKKICEYFKIESQTPLLYGCGQIVRYSGGVANFDSDLSELIRLTMYVRTGCPRCARAKTWISDSIRRKYPGFEVQVRDIISDGKANRDLQTLVRKHGATAASVPVFHVCDKVLVGFDTAATTGPRLETILKRWTVICPKNVSPRKDARSDLRGTRDTPADTVASQGLPGRLNEIRRFASNAEHVVPVFTRPVTILLLAQDFDEEEAPLLREEDSREDDSPLPLPGDTELPLTETSDPDRSDITETIPEDAIELPLFGRVRVETIGLPFFTIAVGLVDGFNPCAMWVLLFLLSVLVNVHSRWKMLAVAGTFVVISGAVYFAFMAAWLNVFLLVGMLTPVRITLSTLAILVGMIHIKDFFAFKRGVSLSIPESAKPGIYARLRGIVTAENLAGAIAGAAVLATLVNVVELLCTAGLPALYTQILSAQQLPIWQNYMYLGIYNLAYMFDDALMVSIAVITLGRRKLQETHGRWLKLISGVTILALGTIMLLRPTWLGMS